MIQTLPNKNTAHLYQKTVPFIIKKNAGFSIHQSKIQWHLHTGLTFISRQEQNRIYIKIDITQVTIYIGM